jgi:hypothetical protein
MTVSVNFFTVYFSLLLFGGMICCGIHAITRGQELEQPDGSKKRVGKIFKSWFFYWYKVSHYNHIFHTGAHLESIFQQFRNHYKGKYEFYSGKKNAMVVSPEFASLAPAIELAYDVYLDCTYEGDRLIVQVAKKEPVYRFPWYVREPLAGCVTCYASAYGSIIFWLFCILSYMGCLGDACMYWSAAIDGIAIYFVWLSYCISLAYVNTFLWIKSGL